MELTGFELFAFFLCSSICGLLFSSEYVSDREITLIIAVFVAVVTLLLTKFSTSRALSKFLTEDVSDVHEKQLKDLTEAHCRRITGLKREHDREQLRLMNRLKDADLKFDYLWGEHDQISTLYQEQVRNNQEQEDRIQYLEKKLQEFGQTTPVARAPFSAPPTQITFLSPPRRNRFKEGLKTPLSKVVEVDDE